MYQMFLGVKVNVVGWLFYESTAKVSTVFWSGIWKLTKKRTIYCFFFHECRSWTMAIMNIFFSFPHILLSIDWWQSRHFCLCFLSWNAKSSLTEKSPENSGLNKRAENRNKALQGRQRLSLIFRRPVQNNFLVFVWTVICHKRRLAVILTASIFAGNVSFLQRDQKKLQDQEKQLFTMESVTFGTTRRKVCRKEVWSKYLIRDLESDFSGQQSCPILTFLSRQNGVSVFRVAVANPSLQRQNPLNSTEFFRDLRGKRCLTLSLGSKCIIYQCSLSAIGFLVNSCLLHFLPEIAIKWIEMCSWEAAKSYCASRWFPRELSGATCCYSGPWSFSCFTDCGVPRKADWCSPPLHPNCETSSGIFVKEMLLGSDACIVDHSESQKWVKREQNILCLEKRLSKMHVVLAFTEDHLFAFPAVGLGMVLSSMISTISCHPGPEGDKNLGFQLCRTQDKEPQE